MAGAQVRPT